MYQTFMILLI